MPTRIPDTISIAARVVVDKDSFVGHRLKFATPVEFVDLTEAFAAENSKFGEVWFLTTPFLIGCVGQVGYRSEISKSVGGLHEISPKVTKHLCCHHHFPAFVLESPVESF